MLFKKLINFLLLQITMIYNNNIELKMNYKIMKLINSLFLYFY